MVNDLHGRRYEISKYGARFLSGGSALLIIYLGLTADSMKMFYVNLSILFLLMLPVFFLWRVTIWQCSRKIREIRQQIADSFKSRELLLKEQKDRIMKGFKSQIVRDIALICMACLCMSSGVYLQSAMAVSPSIRSRVVVVTLSILLFPLALYLLGDVFKLRGYLRRPDYYFEVVLRRRI